MWDVDERARSRLWRRVARKFLPWRARRRLHMWFGDLWIAYRKDRRYLDRELIPAVGRHGGRTLFIGCRKYTKHYPALLVAHGVECWTIDIDPFAATLGRSGTACDRRHPGRARLLASIVVQCHHLKRGVRLRSQ